MIKLGSRTELILPGRPGLAVDVAVGRRVRAGITVLARSQRGEPIAVRRHRNGLPEAEWT